MAANPLHVTVTGAAGQIGYALVHRIASGQLLGPDQPVVLRLLEIEPALPALEGVVMELEDGAHPLLVGIEVISDTAWLQGEFIETVQKRGAAVIEKRGASSAASAAHAAIDSVNSVHFATPGDDFHSVAVCSSG